MSAKYSAGGPHIIRYKGLFDFESLYEAVAEWLKRYGYEFHENAYKHKIPSPRGAEQEISWKAEMPVTDYVKYTIKIRYHLWDMTEVEVARDGERKVLTNARIQIKISGKVITDWQGKFGKNKFTEMLGALYEKIRMREIGANYIEPLQYRLWDLQAFMKKYLDMQTKAHEYAGQVGEKR